MCVSESLPFHDGKGFDFYNNISDTTMEKRGESSSSKKKRIQDTMEKAKEKKKRKRNEGKKIMIEG